MKIDEHNYTAYILDYFEGNLSAQEREELIAFLNANPTYRKEFEEYEHISLIDGDDIFFSGKDELKKKTNLTEEEFFNLTEGNLVGKEKTNVEKIISGNVLLEKELLFWKKTKVQPDLSVVYPKKEKLKRRPVVIQLWQNVYLRAAAVIAIVLGAGWIYFSNGNNPNDVEVIAMSGQTNEKIQIAFQTKKNFIEPADSVFEKNKTSNQNNINLIVNSSYKINIRKNPKENHNDIINNPDTIKSVIVKYDSTSLFKSPEIKNDSTTEAIVKTTADSLIKKELRGTWEPEEALPVVQKGLKHGLLNFAVSCLKGLKKIGVKKADGIKKTDPLNGSTDYTLVLGKRSYSVSR